MGFFFPHSPYKPSTSKLEETFSICNGISGSQRTINWNKRLWGIRSLLTSKEH